MLAIEDMGDIAHPAARRFTFASTRGVIAMRIKSLVFIVCIYGLGLLAGCDHSEGIRPNPEGSGGRSDASTTEGEPALEHADDYARRAYDSLSAGNYDAALKDYDRAVQLQPDQAEFRNSRGFTWHMKGIQDKDRPGCEDKALSDYAEAIRLDPQYASAINNRAWLIATSKVDRCRNGKVAVAEATKACELTGWSNPGYIDTLSCAYAEIGDFGQAIRWQKKALEDPSYQDDEGENAKTKLAVFAGQKPFRE